MEIETKTASLETFSVTIQALHVNGKQMTLAVFRQLPIDGEEEGDQLWGIVKYSIRDEGELWLVFSSEERLYRRHIDTCRPKLRTIFLEEKLEREQKNKESWGYVHGSSREKIDSNIQELESELEERRDAYKEEMAIFEYNQKLLSTLPQLFIAV